MRKVQVYIGNNQQMVLESLLVLDEDGHNLKYYLAEPDEGGVYQVNDEAIQLAVKEVERTWRNTELDWYDNYQKNSLWTMLCCVDQETLYRYYISLLEYPQSEGFPDGVRPVRPALLCDADCTAEQRWEKSVQMELNARRLSPLSISNVLSGDSGLEVPVTILISPTESTISTITAYVAESVINGLVDIWWDTEGGETVKLTVQNLKPVFKSIEKYIRDMYEVRKNLVARFGEEGLVITDDVNWTSRNITLV